MQSQQSGPQGPQTANVLGRVGGTGNVSQIPIGSISIFLASNSIFRNWKRNNEYASQWKYENGKSKPNSSIGSQ